MVSVVVVVVVVSVVVVVALTGGEPMTVGYFRVGTDALSIELF